MKIIDLTYAINAEMPVYPGTEPPIIKVSNTYEKDGFTEKCITFFSHTGTHVDAPKHIFPEGLSLDMFPVSAFVGKGLVIDGKHLGVGGCLGMDAIKKVQALADQADFLLFNWGWDKYWGTPEYFADYPCIGEDVAEYLVKTRKKGVGTDAIGIDPIADSKLTIHHMVLKENIFVFENLRNLSEIGSELFNFTALPLKLADADGAPVRAIAVIEE